jgi:hypothetical protein
MRMNVGSPLIADGLEHEAANGWSGISSRTPFWSRLETLTGGRRGLGR